MTLRHGDRGQDVRTLQLNLNRAGAQLTVTGNYDDATEAAVRAFQQRAGLVVDGDAGPKTLSALGGGQTAHMLRQGALRDAAERLGVPLAAVQAVNAVESSGAGFVPNGRPAILFERHVMYARLKAAPRPGQTPAQRLAELENLVRLYPNVVNPTPGGYVGGNAEHQRLATARQIDDTIGIESASWGLFQIMGHHWSRLGYPSAQAFAQAMGEDEGQQLEAFVRFIETDPALRKALKSRRWAEFARLYNGPAYARNLYDVKLERAFERFSLAEAAA
ncbi:N-acetylmuramidase family protein [Pseudomonas sp. RIT-PI-AD]|uniref:N-acetylmuramidase family protein n=1 Tax=Pseudomonas sp. RIT-PI-AD TaxID=3035294 RepID=UPI0021DA807C|nr:N-acetylmuramidase family protein [Pseudomonas sp. RIT-PI-AD]